jgi:hypothetical protein
MKDALQSRVGELPTHCWPVDKNAAREMWGAAPDRFTTKECPTLCPVPVAEVSRRNNTLRRGGGAFRDLSGQRLGAMTIVGLQQYRENRRSTWIARCDCGNHEPRNHRNWQKYYRYGVPDACRFCMGEDLRRAVVSAILDQLKPQRSPEQ